jgi:hypothetical protein
MKKQLKVKNNPLKRRSKRKRRFFKKVEPLISLSIKNH